MHILNILMKYLNVSITDIAVQSVSYLLTGDRCQARHFYLAKRFCLDTNMSCLVLGESQGSSLCLVRKYPVKPPTPEGDSQTIGTVHTDAGIIDSFFNNQYFYWHRQWDLNLQDRGI